MNIIDDTIIRDLNRIMNDRGVLQQHRNVARRAIAIINQMGEPEEVETDNDPNMVTCVCSMNLSNECSYCDGTGSITREKYIGILHEREERHLEIQGVEL